jgi:hypothetical protein
MQFAGLLMAAGDCKVVVCAVDPSSINCMCDNMFSLSIYSVVLGVGGR